MDADGIFQKLNSHQMQAVLDESPAALVNAGVGSGKTTVLTAKICYLHDKKGVPYSDMAVITFTNKAADEIRERLGAAEEDFPWLGTFHSVAMRMLQKILPVPSLSYTQTFTVMDPGDLLETAAGLIADNNFKIKYLNKLDKRLESYRAGQRLFGIMKKEDDIGLLWESIRAEMKKRNCMDFDDLLINASLLLKQQGSFVKWVIVDEFQDCDSLQLSFIRALMGKDARLFVVGDPNQSIYGWRGGKQDSFAELKNEFHAKEFTLPINYRSSATILEAASHFLQDPSGLSGVRDPGCGIVSAAIITLLWKRTLWRKASGVCTNRASPGGILPCFTGCSASPNCRPPYSGVRAFPSVFPSEKPSRIFPPCNGLYVF